MCTANPHEDDSQNGAPQALAKLSDHSVWWISEHEQELDPAVIVFLCQSAYRKCTGHVERTLETELGGYLVGDCFYDGQAQKYYIIIEDVLEAERAKAGPTYFTFTHESQIAFLDRLADEFPGKKCVGWYHSHPNLGVFLSRDDVFIHRHFFKQPYQVALVIDPRNNEGGFFCRQQHDNGFSEGEHIRRYVGFRELLQGTQVESVVTWVNLRRQEAESEVAELEETEDNHPITEELAELKQQVAELELAVKDLLRRLFVQRAITIQALLFVAMLTLVLAKSDVTFQTILGRLPAATISEDQKTPELVLSDTTTPTKTPRPTPTLGAANTPGLTDTLVLKATDTATPELMDTPIPTATDTAAPKPTDTPIPTDTATPEPTHTAKPIDTPKPKSTAIPRSTNTPVPEPTPVGGLILMAGPSVFQDGQQLSPPYEVDSGKSLTFSFVVNNPGLQAVIVENIGIGEHNREGGKFQSPEGTSPFTIPPGKHTFQITMPFTEPKDYELFVQVREAEGAAWLQLTLPNGKIPPGTKVRVK